MNHIYRIVFNRSLGVYQCVSEIAKAQGKSSGRSATTNRRAGFSVRALSVSILSVLALGTTTGAVATVYDGGQTYNLGPLWTVSPTPGDVVTDSGTLVNAGNLSISETLLRVTNSGEVKIANNVTMVKDSVLDIEDNGRFTAERLDVGGAGVDGTNNNINISTGGQLKAKKLLIGLYDNSEGDLLVTGSNSKLELSGDKYNDGYLLIGEQGNGSAIIEDGASVEAGYIYLGRSKNGEGDLTVTGANSTLKLNGGGFEGDFFIGREGKGSVTIADGGYIQSTYTDIGYREAGEGELTVTGSNSKLMTDYASVGGQGKGSVTIADGGYIQAKYMGVGSDGEGDLLVTGSKSQLKLIEGSQYYDGYLEIGIVGKGRVTIANGASVQAKGVDIGGADQLGTRIGEGDLLVTGSNSQLIADDVLMIGGRGKGGTTISKRGLVQANEVVLGEFKGGEGDLLVTDNKSQLIVNDVLMIGARGKGKATISKGGLVKANDLILGDQSTGEGNLLVTDNNSRLTADGLFVIGREGTGSVTVAKGASVLANGLVLGDQNTGEGDLIATGNKSTLTTGYLFVGDYGKGSVTVAKGASVLTNTMLVGNKSTGEGDLTVTGSNSTLTTGYLVVGNYGKGSAIIADGASVEAKDKIRIGDEENSEGYLTVTGTNSKLIADDRLDIGKYGIGSAIIADGASVKATRIRVGNESTGEGDLTVTGNNSALTTNYLVVGNYGIGSATIANGASVLANTIDIGDEYYSEGDLTVTGNNSTLTTDYLVVGNYGKGSAIIADGASVETKDKVRVGDEKESEGNLLVTGSNSQLSTNDLDIGKYGIGSAIIADGASVKANTVSVGDKKPSKGNLTISGIDSQLTADVLIVGRRGKGNATIADGASVLANTISVGENIGEGELTVTGSNSTLIADDALIVGRRGKGTLNIADEGSVGAGSVYLGNESTGEGDLTVTGSNSTLKIGYDLFDDPDWIYDGILYIGNQGAASATIADGGSVQVENIFIGNESTGEGDLTVTGNNSKLRVESLVVGAEGKGSAIIADGASVNSQIYSLMPVEVVYVGRDSTGEGDLTITGNSSKLTTRNLVVGHEGKGSVNIADSALVEAENVYVGNQSTGEGDLTVTGNNSKLNARNYLFIGREGTASATIADGGLVRAKYIEVGSIYQYANESDLTVTGNNSKMIIGSLRVGGYGKSSATIADGASVEANQLTFASDYGSEGELTVTGNNSKMIIGSLRVGVAGGKGSAIIADGALVEASQLTFGDLSGEGELIVTGSNSKLIADVFTMGKGGKGSAIIADGALVQAVAVYLGDGYGYSYENSINGEGELTVTGNNSQLTADNLVVGYQSDGYKSRNKGTLNIINNGLVMAKNVSRDKDSQLSVINFDKGTLKLAANQSALFNNFTSANTINLAGGGGTIDTDNFNASVFNDARMTGSGGFTKAGDGTLTMNSATMAWDGDTHINQGTLQVNGDYSMREGDLTITGANSKLNTNDLLVIGASGKNSATISKAGSLQADELVLGEQRDDEGELTVTGNNSQVDTDHLTIGYEGTGSATIEDGASVQAYRTYVGDQRDSEGELTVTGSNSKLTADDVLMIGSRGKGSAIIEDGALVQAYRAYIGDQRDGEGEVTVTGSNSTLIADDALIVGRRGKGTLNIIDNGLVIANNVSRDKNSKLSVVNFDNGTLKLGANQSALFNNFTSANTINLAGGGGTIDTNTFNASIFNDARVTGSGDFTKAGAGRLTMNSATKGWDGDTHINQGILQLNGIYEMRENEVLGIGLNTLTDYGQLNVKDGHADISKGQLYVKASEVIPELPDNSVWEKVVSANAIIGEFTDVKDNSPLVDFEALYGDKNVDLKMVKGATLVEAIESESNQASLSLARALDQAIDYRINTGSNKLADALIVNTTNFDQSKLAAAANELQPLLMGSTNRLITDSNYAVTEAITERSLSNPQRGLWAKIIASDSSHDEVDGITGYDADSYGAIVGIDSPINDRLNLGVAVSYIDNDADSNSRSLAHEMRAKNWQVLGYGNYAATDATQVNFHGGAGSSDVKGQRYVANMTADSDYSVDTLQAGFGIGHQIGNELRSVTPFAQMNYARAKSDGYRETGAGVYNLNVDDNTYESMRWTAGVKMSQSLTPKLALTGQLAAALENGDRRSDITASFIELPDASFTTSGQEIGREIGIVGVGLSYMPTANTKLSAGYRGEWRDNYNDQGASIALQTFF